MNVYEVPLSPTPQIFSIPLSGVTYRLSFQWVESIVSSGWVMNIADAQGAPIVNGIPLVTGINLLGQYDYLGFVGGMAVQTDHDQNAVPTFLNLGETSHLLYVTP